MNIYVHTAKNTPANKQLRRQTKTRPYRLSQCLWCINGAYLSEGLGCQTKDAILVLTALAFYPILVDIVMTRCKTPLLLLLCFMRCMVTAAGCRDSNLECIIVSLWFDAGFSITVSYEFLRNTSPVPTVVSGTKYDVSQALSTVTSSCVSARL